MQQRNELYHREIHQRQISAFIIQHYWVRSRRREVSDFLCSMAHTLSLEEDSVYEDGCLVRMCAEAFRIAARSVPHTHELFETGEALRHEGRLLSGRFSIRNTRHQPFSNDQDQVLRQHQQACFMLTMPVHVGGSSRQPRSSDAQDGAAVWFLSSGRVITGHDRVATQWLFGLQQFDLRRPGLPLVAWAPPPFNWHSLSTLLGLVRTAQRYSHLTHLQIERLRDTYFPRQSTWKHLRVMWHSPCGSAAYPEDPLRQCWVASQLSHWDTFLSEYDLVYECSNQLLSPGLTRRYRYIDFASRYARFLSCLPDAPGSAAYALQKAWRGRHSRRQATVVSRLQNLWRHRHFRRLTKKVMRVCIDAAKPIYEDEVANVKSICAFAMLIAQPSRARQMVMVPAANTAPRAVRLFSWLVEEWLSYLQRLDTGLVPIPRHDRNQSWPKLPPPERAVRSGRTPSFWSTIHGRLRNTLAATFRQASVVVRVWAMVGWCPLQDDGAYVPVIESVHRTLSTHFTAAQPRPGMRILSPLNHFAADIARAWRRHQHRQLKRLLVTFAVKVAKDNSDMCFISCRDAVVSSLIQAARSIPPSARFRIECPRGLDIDYVNPTRPVDSMGHQHLFRFFCYLCSDSCYVSFIRTDTDFRVYGVNRSACKWLFDLQSLDPTAPRLPIECWDRVRILDQSPIWRMLSDAEQRPHQPFLPFPEHVNRSSHDNILESEIEMLEDASGYAEAPRRRRLICRATWLRAQYEYWMTQCLERARRSMVSSSSLAAAQATLAFAIHYEDSFLS